MRAHAGFTRYCALRRARFKFAAMPGLHETIVAELKANQPLWVQIAQLSDVSYHTLIKVAQGSVKAPRIKTVEKIARGLLELRRIQKIANERDAGNVKPRDDEGAAA